MSNSTFNQSNIDITFDVPPMEPMRQQQLHTWLQAVLPTAIGQKHQQTRETALTVRLSAASVDASFRSYYRVHISCADGNFTSWIVMDAPPAQEATEPFYRIATLLVTANVPAPQIAAWDESAGFMLLQDFGDQTLLIALDEAPESAIRRHYEQALSVLVTMQSIAPQATQLPVYDEAFLRCEMELFRQWMLWRHLGRSWSLQDERQWQQTMKMLCHSASAQPQVFVHRDYHSRNLMIRPQEMPGVIDFQGAMQGPLMYDVVSLLKDCYVKLEPTLRVSLLNYYVALAQEHGVPTLSADQLITGFDHIGAQRQLKVAGIFARLYHRDGKPGYLPDVPRTLSYIVDAAEYDSQLDWLAELIQSRVLPLLDEKMPRL